MSDLYIVRTWPDPPITDTEIERICRNVIESPPSRCLLWCGSVDDGGYARVWFRGRNWHAAQLIWSLFAGRRVRPGYEVDHTCRTRRCINPDHLQEVTHPVNVRLAFERAAGSELVQVALEAD